VDDTLETNRPRPTIARWLLALLAVVCVLALVEGGWLSWSRSPSEAGSVSLASRPGHPLIAPVPARRGSGSDLNQSGRMPIRVSIERAHVQVKCASDGRVPIAIMEQCHRHGAVRALIP
jgi:hypothetical protein